MSFLSTPSAPRRSQGVQTHARRCLKTYAAYGNPLSSCFARDNGRGRKRKAARKHETQNARAQSARCKMQKQLQSEDGGTDPAPPAAGVTTRFPGNPLRAETAPTSISPAHSPAHPDFLRRFRRLARKVPGICQNGRKRTLPAPTAGETGSDAGSDAKAQKQEKTRA